MAGLNKEDHACAAARNGGERGAGGVTQGARAAGTCAAARNGGERGAGGVTQRES